MIAGIQAVFRYVMSPTSRVPVAGPRVSPSDYPFESGRTPFLGPR